MALTKCRECGGQVSTEADDCPHCGCENPARSRFLNKGVQGFLIIVGGVAALVLFGGRLSEAPGCEVGDVEISGDTFFVDGRLDAGFALTARIANRGDAAALFKIVATLSTSEGDFERTQELVLQPGVTRAVQYGFHEPTVNSVTSQGRVSCRAVKG